MDAEDPIAILQLLPAPGWRVIFLEEEDGQWEGFASELIGWGVTAEGSVVPLCACEDGEVLVANDGAPNFVMLLSPGTVGDEDRVVARIEARKAQMVRDVEPTESPANVVRFAKPQDQTNG